MSNQEQGRDFRDSGAREHEKSGTYYRKGGFNDNRTVSYREFWEHYHCVKCYQAGHSHIRCNAVDKWTRITEKELDRLRDIERQWKEVVEKQCKQEEARLVQEEIQKRVAVELSKKLDRRSSRKDLPRYRNDRYEQSSEEEDNNAERIVQRRPRKTTESLETTPSRVDRYNSREDVDNSRGDLRVHDVQSTQVWKYSPRKVIRREKLIPPKPIPDITIDQLSDEDEDEKTLREYDRVDKECVNKILRTFEELRDKHISNNKKVEKTTAYIETILKEQPVELVKIVWKGLTEEVEKDAEAPSAKLLRDIVSYIAKKINVNAV